MKVQMDVLCENSSSLSPDDLEIIRNHVATTHPVLLYMDYVCVSFFLLEIILRLLTVPDKKVFIMQPLNIIDIVCLIPHVVSIILKTFFPYADTAALIKSVMILRIIRILRLFKLMKHYTAFKILLYTIKVSTRELMLVIIFLLLGVLIFGSIMHFVDQKNFPNIPIGVWWAIVTMTTVGYGDITPNGVGGYLIGTVCVVCGVLVIAFTVPIVVNNFSMFYSYAQSRGKLPHGRGICKLKRAYAGGKLKQSLLQIAACEKLKHVKSSRNAPKDSTIVDIQVESKVYERDAPQVANGDSDSDNKPYKLSELAWLSKETSKIMKKMSGRQDQLNCERTRQFHECQERRERKRNSLSGASRCQGACRNEYLSNGVLQSMSTASAVTPTAITREDATRGVSCDGGCTIASGVGDAVNSVGVVGINAGGVVNGDIGVSSAGVGVYNRIEVNKAPARNHFGFSRYAAKFTTTGSRNKSHSNTPSNIDRNAARTETSQHQVGVSRELLKPPQRIRTHRRHALQSPPATTRDVVVKHK